MMHKRENSTLYAKDFHYKNVLISLETEDSRTFQISIGARKGLSFAETVEAKEIAERLTMLIQKNFKPPTYFSVFKASDQSPGDVLSIPFGVNYSKKDPTKSMKKGFRNDAEDAFVAAYELAVTELNHPWLARTRLGRDGNMAGAYLS